MASSKAPRLTAANALKAVKGVARDWKWLGAWLNIPLSTCDDIKQRHSNDRGRLEAIIEQWLKVDPSPTWRRVIRALDGMEHRTADSVRQYAEPLTDPTHTVHNVTTVVAPVRDWDNLGIYLGVPQTKRDEIRSKYSTDEKKKEALIDYWLCCSPVASWGKLAGVLHFMEEKQSLQLVQRHLKKTSEPTLTLHNLCQALAEVEDWHRLGVALCVPLSKRDEIKAKYPDRVEAKRQMLHHFLTSHPAPSWGVVFEELYRMGDYDVKNHHILQDVRRRYGRGKELFNEAMKSGFVETLAIKVVVTGAAGSGKSCAKEVILGRKPPKKRVSTKLAQRPVRLDRAQTLESNWKTVTQDRIQAMVADVIKSLELNKSQAEAESTTMPAESSHETNRAPTEAPPPSSTDAKLSAQEQKSRNQSPSAASKEGAPTKVKTVPLASDTEEELLRLLQQAPSSVPVLRFEWVYFVDSGGQPQFHEILPVFLKGASICIFVHKLSETLDEHPVIEFYDDNSQLVGKSCVSAHSNMQVFQHCLRTMQSHGSQAAKGKPPKILILGTHADLEHTCTETRLDKNRRLLEILLPTVPNEIIYNGQDKKQVIFPMNVQDPGEAEYRIAEQIRELIMKEGSPEVHKIPLSWYVLEQVLRELAQKLGRGVLRKEECFTIASSLHFTEETFLAALQYLDDLNILFYYPDILPEVVFTDPQIVLDKASELVQFSYQLQEEPKEGVVFKAEWRKFQDYGLVTAEFLSEFNDHYVEGIFTPKELIKLFKALLVLADFSATEFFMPALLRILDCGEVEKHRVSKSSVVDPLVIYFPHGPRNGMFCSLITFLLSSDNHSPFAWELHLASGSPTRLYRNSVKFVIPKHPGSITLIDSFAQFEAHIIAPTTKICGFVRNAVFEGLGRASRILNYNNSTPQPAFLCPCDEDSTHAATVGADETFWICSQNSEKWGQLQDKQRVWLQSAGPAQTLATLGPSSLTPSSGSPVSATCTGTEEVVLGNFSVQVKEKCDDIIEFLLDNAVTPDGFATKLERIGLINKAVREKAELPTVPNSERMRTVMNAVISRLRLNEQNAEKLKSVLEKFGLLEDVSQLITLK